MKIYIVRGEHFRIPAVPSTAHTDLRQAHGEAANLVALLWKDLADDGGDGFEVTPDNWQDALKSAQLQRVMDEQGLDDAPDMDGPDLIEASGMDVWIEEYEVAGHLIPQSTIDHARQTIEALRDGLHAFREHDLFDTQDKRAVEMAGEVLPLLPEDE